MTFSSGDDTDSYEEASPNARLRSKFTGIWAGRLQPVIFIAAMFVIWEILTRYTALFPDYILPQPTDVFARMISSWEVLFDGLRTTLLEVVLGFLIGAVVGVALALPIAYSRPIRQTLYPLIVASQAVPKVAIAPLLVAWLGLGMAPKLAVVALMVFFPVTMTAAQGFSSVDRSLLDLLRSVNVGRWQVFWQVRLPHSLPPIFAGLKIGVTLAVVGAVVGEWVGASSGLGYLLLYANTQLDSTLLFAALFLLVGVSIVLFVLIELAERILLPWREESSTETPAVTA